VTAFDELRVDLLDITIAVRLGEDVKKRAQTNLKPVRIQGHRAGSYVAGSYVTERQLFQDGRRELLPDGCGKLPPTASMIQYLKEYERWK
jgi:hypothetical protein